MFSHELSVADTAKTSANMHGIPAIDKECLISLLFDYASHGLKQASANKRKA